MNTSPRKIWLILFSIILIPVLIFAVLQLTTLNENEKIIKDIYSKQLDAILYSVNQYSEDVVSSWKNKIKAFPEETGSTENYFKKFLNENPTIKFLFLTDSLRNIKFKTTDSVSNEQINLFLSSNNDKINNLYKFKESGYERVEPVNGKIFSNTISLIFLNDKNICVLTIDPYLFIRNILEPKLQEVSREEFNLSVYDSTNSNTVYSTNKTIQEIEQERSLWFREVEQYRSLWLLSGFSLGISLRGASIQELAEDRVYTNIILVLGLAILLIAGNWFVYRNTKKEIELARIKSDFVSNVSHELRTPLSLINMFAETLELDRVKSDEKKKEYYSIISNEANRLSRIVNKILNFSRMEAGKKTYNFTNVNINEIVLSTFNTYKFHLQNNGFTFKLIQSENLPEIYV
ncbi:MAG TPA: histidine kinase dimerization/phospho-acceptor domain-containing protein, partial [Ignavibacteriaceae bacterium]|nr:histidine kinase dimerization/phospho-acceptor domain-containing protein [Ignavibacteriaceae bacterium]